MSCLPIDNIDTLRREAKAWADARNGAQTGVDWQFTNEQARIKLNRQRPVSASYTEMRY